MKKITKATIDDGCNPELVTGASFDGILKIPIIEKPNKIIIPSGITPFSQIEKHNNFHEAIGFYENDVLFADVLINPEEYIPIFNQHLAVIGLDCSLYRNAPLAVQITNIYKSRAIGSYYQRHGSYVIPNIRWGDELTYTTKYFPEKPAFLGVRKQSIVSIGTYGCIKTKENAYYFKAGLDAMLQELEPLVVLVYGSMPSSIFEEYIKYSQFIQYDDWTTRCHKKGGDTYGNR